MYLLPQLPTPFAEALANQLCELSVEQCRQHRRLEDNNQIFTPTGGTRIPDANYAALRDGLAAVAEKAGYPKDSAAAREQFDVEAALLLYERFQITDNEASRDGIWNFLCCVALPDLVRWRWAASELPTERYLGGVRNTFQRLWWRAKAYYDAGAPDPHWLLREIGEDESVGIMERTGLSGTRPFAVAVLKALIECHRNSPVMARSELMREAMKRFRRLGAVLALEALSPNELQELCTSVFRDTIGQPKTMTAKTATAAKQPDARPAPPQKPETSTPHALSPDDLAWLEADIKRNQGRRR
jgi:hypothetical protein